MKNKLTQKLIARFFSKVNKNGPIPSHNAALGNCWVWQGYVNDCGYGKIFWDKKAWGAHRVAFIIFNGRMPENLVCHKCDNPPCVRPDHLWDGTKKENNLDAEIKGRYVLAELSKKNKLSRNNCPYGHPYYGENLIIRKKYGTKRTIRECRKCRSIYDKILNFKKRHNIESGIL